MVGRLSVGFVWINLWFSVSWQEDFQWGSCGSIFRFLCHGCQIFSGVRVAQSLVFCVMVGRLLVGFVWLNLYLSVSWLVDSQWGSCGSIFRFLCHGWKTFSGVRVSQSLVFCVTVGRILVGFVWLNLWLSASWLGDFSWGSCGSIFTLLSHGWQTLMGFMWLNIQISVSWQVDFQWGSCGSIFRFLCDDWQTFSGVRVAQSLDFCVMIGRLLVGFVWLNLQFCVSWQVDFQWGTCGSIFRFLCHVRYTFSVVRVAQSLVFLARLVDFQCGSCVSIFSFLCHGRQTFSGVRVAQSLDFCVMLGIPLVWFVWLNLQSFWHGWQTFSEVRVAQSLVFCVMVGRPLAGFVCLNLQFDVSWLVDFQWGSFCAIFSRLCHGWQTFSGVCSGSIFSVMCHGRQTFSGVRATQSLVFCVMVCRLLVEFVWFNLQFSVSWQVDFQLALHCSTFNFLCHGWQIFQWSSCGSIFSFLCHGWQILYGLRVAQSLVFCVMLGILLVGFMQLNLSFSVSWQVDFQ